MAVSKKRKASRTNKKPVERAKKVRLAIECTPLERRRMKMLAASQDKTLNEFVLESVRMRFQSCKKGHFPNIETFKAMKDTEKRNGIIEFDSYEDFFKAMEE
ncbi:MAG: hypothetical protein KF898_08165 [Parachlamydiales bacterium]|nr:hypothetical protein [Candidatus Acheromyda pituitae]